VPAKQFYQIVPINSDQFKYFGGKGYPSVGNQTLIVSYSNNVSILIQKMNQSIVDLLNQCHTSNSKENEQFLTEYQQLKSDTLPLIKTTIVNYIRLLTNLASPISCIAKRAGDWLIRKEGRNVIST
jgi:hypothetical protein